MFCALVLCLAPIGAAAEPSVRVLLADSADAVEVRRGGDHTSLRPAPGGVRANGQLSGGVWRAAGGETVVVDGVRVRGAVEVERVAGGLRVVNEVPLEAYVAGTVGREVYAFWSAETLKAQAVVSRTYALHERALRARRAFDVFGGTQGQVYGGVDAESPAVVAATHATRGEYLAWQAKPILAVFHSASGGQTASSEEVWGRAAPYLVSLPVENEEDSPDTYWRASISGTTLGRALARLGLQIGTVREIRVIDRSPSGRALRVQVSGDGGDSKLGARELRSALGENVIRSTLFEIRPAEDGFAFVGAGHGHGVGMSQWGAEGMARRGADYRRILATFFPGTELSQGLTR
ncbi:MAG TPA: SpoIID/LytB domain-containing protein [Myxococcota bacterium]